MSGLALACEIANLNTRNPEKVKSALVIEPRTVYQQDKTWCFWQTTNGFFDAAITHKWHRWQVSVKGLTYTSEYASTPYVRVDSGVYYKLAQEHLAQSDDIDLLLGTTARTLQVNGSEVVVACDDFCVTSEYVYDTRPQEIPADSLLQHFAGWEITTKNDTFNPEVVTLMDFQPTQNDDIHFFYVLPFSAKHALIETTHFSKNVLSEGTYQKEIEKYLIDSLGVSNWEILREERGVIPMPKKSPALAQREFSNVIPFGLHADTPRPSTGYCYPHAQTQASVNAAGLFAREPEPANTARTFFIRWLDQIFISFLEHHPDKAANVFLNLFQRVPDEGLIRFLGDGARPGDYLKVILAMPKTVFIVEALRCASKS